MARSRDDQSIWCAHQTSPSGPWTDWIATGALGSEPALARNADGRVEAFVRGLDGIKALDSVAASKVTPSYLFDELPKRLARGPVKFRLVAQLANPGDQTSDGSIVWPEDRKLVELGMLNLTTVAPDNAALQKSLAFSPVILTDGIQLSDDPFPVLRASVYALSVAHRN